MNQQHITIDLPALGDLIDVLYRINLALERIARHVEYIDNTNDLKLETLQEIRDAIAR